MKRILFGVLVVVLLAAVPAMAHHAFSAEYDRDKPITLKGKITKVEALDTETALKQLIGGRTDCYVHSKAGILWALKKLKKAGFVQNFFKDPIRISSVLFKDWGYLAYTNRDMGDFPYKDDFIMKVDAIIKAMKENGRIKKIASEFLNRSGTL